METVGNWNTYTGCIGIRSRATARQFGKSLATSMILMMATISGENPVRRRNKYHSPFPQPKSRQALDSPFLSDRISARIAGYFPRNSLNTRYWRPVRPLTIITYSVENMLLRSCSGFPPFHVGRSADLLELRFRNDKRQPTHSCDRSEKRGRHEPTAKSKGPLRWASGQRGPLGGQYGRAVGRAWLRSIWVSTKGHLYLPGRTEDGRSETADIGHGGDTRHVHFPYMVISWSFLGGILGG